MKDKKGICTKVTWLPQVFYTQMSDDEVVEPSIVVTYFKGSVELKQGNNVIDIDTRFVKDLFKQILSNLPAALEILESR